MSESCGVWNGPCLLAKLRGALLAYGQAGRHDHDHVVAASMRYTHSATRQTSEHTQKCILRFLDVLLILRLPP